MASRGLRESGRCVPGEARVSDHMTPSRGWRAPSPQSAGIDSTPSFPWVVVWRRDRMGSSPPTASHYINHALFNCSFMRLYSPIYFSAYSIIFRFSPCSELFHGSSIDSCHIPWRRDYEKTTNTVTLLNVLWTSLRCTRRELYQHICLVKCLYLRGIWVLKAYSRDCWRLWEPLGCILGRTSF